MSQVSGKHYGNVIFAFLKLVYNSFYFTATNTLMVSRHQGRRHRGGRGGHGRPTFRLPLKKKGKPRYINTSDSSGWTALDVLQSWLTVSISSLGLCVWERVQNAMPYFLLRRARPPHFEGAGAGVTGNSVARKFCRSRQYFLGNSVARFYQRDSIS